jgi:lysozyme
MKTSNVGIQLIQEFESLHDGDLTMIGLQPKMDPVGIWTMAIMLCVILKVIF